MDLNCVACAAALRTFGHTAMLRSDRSGLAEIAVVGLWRDAAHDGVPEVCINPVQVQ